MDTIGSEIETGSVDEVGDIGVILVHSDQVIAWERPFQWFSRVETDIDILRATFELLVKHRGYMEFMFFAVEKYDVVWLCSSVYD